MLAFTIFNVNKEFAAKCSKLFPIAYSLTRENYIKFYIYLNPPGSFESLSQIHVFDG